MSWVGTWPGGRIWKDKKGRKTFVIRRQIRGKEYAISTGCTFVSSALEHLKRFEADPEGYDPSKGLPGDPVAFTEELCRAYLRWCRDIKKNDPEWIGKKRNLLAWWIEQVGEGRDLRRVTTSELVEILDGTALAPKKTPGRAGRIETIKAFYSWLRTEAHLIEPAEDPLFGRLKVPQGRPQQETERKAFSAEHHRKVAANADALTAARLEVLAGTGWHVVELIRFARSGEIMELPKRDRIKDGAHAALVCPRRKSGVPMVVRVSKRVTEAARKVREYGGFAKYPFYQAVKAASVAAKVPYQPPGRYRHSAATHAWEQGSDPGAAAKFFGHSQNTMRKFYATLAMTPKVKTMA